MDQGRRDDIYSVMYSLIFLHTGTLPWASIKNEDDIANMKEKMEDAVLLKECPPEWSGILKHVRSLPYEKRPDYKYIYDQFYATMTRLNVS